jgi:TonB-dependent receptor
LLLGFLVLPAAAQERKASVTGRVTDASHGVLPGARVELQPGGKAAISDTHGDFTLTDVSAGKYSLTVAYVGFSPFTQEINVTADAGAHIDAVLTIGTRDEAVIVRGERAHGEVEAINIERTADNIVQVLPNEVITSLPNTNIADAVGRLPSVSLERDEGEGKYIQIRGTEPRLSNVTINGIHVPSPEGVRNVKLDVIPADLVDMVEISKTLSANQDADAIGGSVNLVTKSSTDRPYVSLLGLGGYTPISGGRNQYQLAGTAGQRFGQDKRFGLLFGATYDYNARAIHDIEPGPAVTGAIDLRNYLYDRSRYGFGGEADYKLADMSSLYFRGLFSRFKDYGEDWIYSPGISNFITTVNDPNNTCGLTNVSGVQGCGGMSFTNVYRKPEQRIFSTQAGARHALRSVLLTYEVALSQARYTGGFPRAGFGGPGSSDNSVAFGLDTKNPFVPKFPVLNGVNIYDPSQYTLSYASTENDSIFERDVVGDASLVKSYNAGSHYGSLEIGFKGWDARKTQRIDREDYNLPASPLLMSQFLNNFRTSNYYFGEYTYGPVTSFQKILAAVAPGGTTPNDAYNLQNAFDISERIWAGYVMNTISFGRLRLQAGVRFESTQDDLRANKLNFDPVTGDFLPPAIPLTASNGYVDVFPSVQAQYRLGSDTVLRASYGAGIARPNFGDIAPYLTDTPHTTPEFAGGNPDLKPTHAQNFDVLAEHYLKALGLIQAGFFYKALSDPIYTNVAPYQTNFISTLQNGPSAHIAGFEAAWQQRLSFLPGLLKGMGVRANYSHTTSQATFPSGQRTDHPTLLRTAPNNWNFDATYDRKGISARLGLTHNDAYLWSYAGAASPGPSGDTYLYPHTQVDAQVSYRIPGTHGMQAVVSGLNLNNEVFGFYNGSEQYPIQREYYGRTVSFGLRWIPFSGENK